MDNDILKSKVGKTCESEGSGKERTKCFGGKIS
jgi:hypothetical protein